VIHHRFPEAIPFHNGLTEGTVSTGMSASLSVIIEMFQHLVDL
jgi:hypothetical protein